MPKIYEFGPIARDPRSVCALVYEELALFEFSIAAEIFGLPRPEFGDDWYRFTTASEDGKPVRAKVGVTVTPHSDLSAIAGAGLIIVAGWRIEDEAPSERLRAAMLAAVDDGARIVSICSGAFLLASLGLLDGRRATTHWLYAAALAEKYPQIEVDGDVLFVDEGQVVTSAGSAAGVDLLLHLVRHDFGAERANTVARRLVMPAHREGDQRQFVAAPVARGPDDRLRPLVDQIRAQPGCDWSIDALAKAAAMSRRTFIRRFREATGQSPAAFVRQVRLDAARDGLEGTQGSLDQVALAAGYASVATMTDHFSRAMGVSPAAYRRRFRR